MVSIVAENNFKNAENDNWKCFDKLAEMVRIDNTLYQNKPFLFAETSTGAHQAVLQSVYVAKLSVDKTWPNLPFPNFTASDPML